MVGCASPVQLTRQGATVRFVDSSIRTSKDCLFLGVVEANERGDWGLDWAPAQQSAANSIRNKVADMRGNVAYIVFARANEWSGKYLAQAEAYDCKARESDAIVKEKPVPENMQMSFGSGMLVSEDGYILTNYHVVDGCKEIAVDPSSQKATQIGEDRNSDLALLFLENGNGSAHVKFRKRVVSIGEDVIAVGFPLPGIVDGLTVTKGQISSSSGIGGDSRHVQISAPIQPGSSGGPLLDKSGRVIGMVFSTLDPIKQVVESGYIPQNVNFAIRSHVLIPFLDLYGVQYEVSDVDTEKFTENIAEEASQIAVRITCSR